MSEPLTLKDSNLSLMYPTGIINLSDKNKLSGQFFIKHTGLNRKQLREMYDDIPHNDLIVLSKSAEISGDELSLGAFVLLYRKKNNNDKKAMIKNCLEIINDTPRSEK